jgi:hypothetical protein
MLMLYDIVKNVESVYVLSALIMLNLIGMGNLLVMIVEEKF